MSEPVDPLTLRTRQVAALRALLADTVAQLDEARRRTAELEAEVGRATAAHDAALAERDAARGERDAARTELEAARQTGRRPRWLGGG